MKNNSCIYSLFKDAKTSASWQFLLSLLRAEGLTCETPDKVRSFYFFLQDIKQRIKNKTLDNSQNIFKRLITEYDTYLLLANLIRNALGETYKLYPLPHGQTNIGFVSSIVPRKGVHIDTLLEKAECYKEKNPEFYNLLSSAFNETVKKIYKEEIEFNPNKDFAYLQQLIDFFYEFLKKYYRVLKNFTEGQKFYPLPNCFSIIELLIDDDGLFGFDIHHSNGSHSYFKRYKDRTEQMCYSFNRNGEINIFMGSLEATKHMWMLSGKPFYEIGFPGRYNSIGEWKPIVYPGKSDEIQKKAIEATKNEKDRRIAGCLFCAMATTRHAIEFIVKANFEIPYDFLSTSVENFKIQIHKIKMPKTLDNINSNIQIYDSTIFLPDIKVSTISNALDIIGTILNRIAFRVNGEIKWFLKYNIYRDINGKISLNKKDFKLLGDYLISLKGSDMLLIDSAMSWYTAAKNSTNIFTQYLDYYIAMERLSIALIDGEMNIGEEFEIEILTKEEKKKRIEECIKKKHELVYQNNPVDFVKQAYSECIQSLKNKTLMALTKVFGQGHDFVKAFLEKDEGKNMYDLRNDLAHGNFNHINQEEIHLIKKKIYLLEKIVYELIIKLSIGPNKKQKRFNCFSMGLIIDDPRSVLVTSTLKNFSRTDWKIQWEWLN